MRHILFLSLVLAACGVRAGEPACPWLQDDPTDEVGATRSQTPEKALQAIRLVRSGETFRLGHEYDEVTLGDPPPFGRVFDLTVTPFSFSELSQSFHTGVLTAHIGQLGTQFDALGHAGHDLLGFYNCWSQQELGPNDLGQLERLGVENVRPIVTRAVFLDFVAHSTAPKLTLPDGHVLVADSYVITRADVEEVLRNQKVAGPGEGDVVIVYTGWDHLFGVDNERHFDSPGVGIEVARWLAKRRIVMLGSDTQHSEAAVGGRSTELVADPDALGPGLGFIFNAVHFILLTQNGIHLMEWMRLEHLASALLADHRPRATRSRGAIGNGRTPYEFLFTYSPLPITGVAGSPASPLAIR